jgi:hypothetical protein
MCTGFEPLDGPEPEVYRAESREPLRTKALLGTKVPRRRWRRILATEDAAQVAIAAHVVEILGHGMHERHGIGDRVVVAVRRVRAKGRDHLARHGGEDVVGLKLPRDPVDERLTVGRVQLAGRNLLGGHLNRRCLSRERQRQWLSLRPSGLDGIAVVRDGAGQGAVHRGHVSRQRRAGDRGGARDAECALIEAVERTARGRLREIEPELEPQAIASVCERAEPDAAHGGWRSLHGERSRCRGRNR